MHTINGGEREGGGGGKRDAFTSRILYIQLSRNREFLDRRSSTDRKIEGKRSSLKKKKKRKKFFLSLSRDTPPLYSTFSIYSAIKSLRGLFRNYCILDAIRSSG